VFAVMVLSGWWGGGLWVVGFGRVVRTERLQCCDVRCLPPIVPPLCSPSGPHRTSSRGCRAIAWCAGSRHVRAVQSLSRGHATNSHNTVECLSAVTSTVSFVRCAVPLLPLGYDAPAEPVVDHNDYGAQQVPEASLVGSAPPMQVRVMLAHVIHVAGVSAEALEFSDNCRPPPQRDGVVALLQ
jgi:hypothetical protein